MQRKGKLLVDIDTIFDTRLTILTQVTSPAYATSILVNNYQERMEDGFGVDDWDTKYADRNISTLRASFITNMVPVLINIIKSAGDGVGIAKAYDILTLSINTHPYVLNTKEKDLLAELISTTAGELLDIEFLLLSPMFTTPQWLQGNYMGFIKYDGASWLTLHVDDLLSNPIPEITMFLPKIISGDVSLEQDIRDISDKMDPNSDEVFSALEAGLIESISLDFLDISAFNVNMEVLNRTADSETRT